MNGHKANQDMIAVIQRVERCYKDQGDRTQGQKSMGQRRVIRALQEWGEEASAKTHRFLA